MTDRETRREGWYADPLGQADLRWWDSQNWTTQVTSSRPATSRAAAGQGSAGLLWADDEPPAQPAGGTNRVAPPRVTPNAEPKFALGAQAASGAPEPEPTTDDSTDWSPLMLSLLTASDKIVVAKAAGLPAITIDMVERTYWWDLALDSFPAHPVDLIVNSIPRVDATKPAVAGRYIEPLLWRVGTAAPTLSKRVDPALRYKLRRWPDLASLPHTADQLRAINMLANAHLTAAELSAIADVSDKDARTLIGTFALMSVLESVKDPAASK